MRDSRYVSPGCWRFNNERRRSTNDRLATTALPQKVPGCRALGILSAYEQARHPIHRRSRITLDEGAGGVPHYRKGGPAQQGPIAVCTRDIAWGHVQGEARSAVPSCSCGGLMSNHPSWAESSRLSSYRYGDEVNVWGGSRRLVGHCARWPPKTYQVYIYDPSEFDPPLPVHWRKRLRMLAVGGGCRKGRLGSVFNGTYQSYPTCTTAILYCNPEDVGILVMCVRRGWRKVHDAAEVARPGC